MKHERCVPWCISFRPPVLRAIRHYFRYRAVDGDRPTPPHFSLSMATNELLEMALSIEGFDPGRLKLLGQEART